MASEKLVAVFAVLKGRDCFGAGEDPAVEYSTGDVAADVITSAFTLIDDVMRSGATGVGGGRDVIYGKRHLGTGVTAFSKSELLVDSAQRSVFHHHVIGLRFDSASEEFLRIRPWDLDDHFIGNDEYLGTSTGSKIRQVLTDRTQAITPDSIASAIAASSTIPPRAQFTIRAVLFIVRNSSAFTRFSVSGVRGMCRVM